MPVTQIYFVLYVKYGWNRSKEWWLIDYHHFHLQKRSIRRMRCQRHSKYIGVFIIQHWLHHVSSQSSIGVCCTTVSDRIRKLYSGNTRESIVCVRHDPDSNWAEELYKWLLISVYMHLQGRTRTKNILNFQLQLRFRWTPPICCRTPSILPSCCWIYWLLVIRCEFSICCSQLFSETCSACSHTSTTYSTARICKCEAIVLAYIIEGW